MYIRCAFFRGHVRPGFEEVFTSFVRDKLAQVVDRVRRKKRLAFHAVQAQDRDEMELYWRLARKVVPTLYRMKAEAKQKIGDSRLQGTHNLVNALSTLSRRTVTVTPMVGDCAVPASTRRSSAASCITPRWKASRCTHRRIPARFWQRSKRLRSGCAAAAQRLRDKYAGPQPAIRLLLPGIELNH